jgi:hypothetical protein
LEVTASKLQSERAELDAVLASHILGRTNYLVRLLIFVCEKYFDGETDDIKEYSIAVHALGRSPDFDPQVDTIVRVTAHTLRKRLEEYYRIEGADHAVQICLPAGRYVPSFVHRYELASEGNGGSHAGESSSVSHGDLPVAQKQEAAPEPRHNGARAWIPEEVPHESHISISRRLFSIAGAVLFVACLGVAGFLIWRGNGDHSPIANAQAAAAPVKSSPVFRVMLGDGRAPYTDKAGFLWQSDQFCTGGDSFSPAKPLVPGAVHGMVANTTPSAGEATIQGTNDSPLFLSGRHGVFHCSFPVTPGVYEVHLLFAETAGLQENARTVGFSLNEGPANSLDVVDDAGGGDAATTKVFTDVEPISDGNIHLDFISPDSFLNAVEIVPGVAHRALPVRIIAGRNAPYRDSAGNFWLPDRDFSGGRPSQVGNPVTNLPDSGIYDGQRIGHFHYVIPVPPGRPYTLKLHFIERWFGIQNQNVGGIGSRIFDVSCNGSVLLKNFDIMKEAGGAPLIKSFPHIQPTPQGKIEVYFTPAVNYPSISAIEVIPE